MPDAKSHHDVRPKKAQIALARIIHDPSDLVGAGVFSASPLAFGAIAADMNTPRAERHEASIQSG
jgi:hypothetical protein